MQNKTHRLGARNTSASQKYIFDKRSPDTVVEHNSYLTTNILSNQGVDITEASDDSNLFAMETFASMYGNPDLIDSPSCPDFIKYGQEVVDSTPEFKDLKSACYSDVDFSLLAASELIKEFNSSLEGYFKEIENQKDEDSPFNFNEAEWTDSAIRSSMRSAIKKQANEVKEIKATMSMIMPGSEKAPMGKDQESDTRLKLIKRIRDSKNLSKILEKCGLVKRIIRDDVKKATDHGYDEIVDIERGNDISRLLPSSLAMLGDKHQESLFYKDYAEKQLTQYQLIGYEHMGRGDMVILLDESSSMRATAGNLSRHDWTRVLALAAIYVAKKENRQITIIGFNADIRYIAEYSSNGSAKYNGSPADPLKVSLDILEGNCSGGTSFDPAFRTGLNYLNNGRSDIIFITDGEASASDSTINEVKSHLDLGVYGIQIGGTNHIQDSLKSVCTSIINLDTSGSIEDALAKVFSGGN
jgi:uncharacterized protein with von Willebrand factor type A (vWA) domain